jgi:hypothetical protein
MDLEAERQAPRGGGSSSLEHSFKLPKIPRGHDR